MKKHASPLVLIIDDEKAILKTLQDALTDEDYRAETLDDGNGALEKIGALVPDLILLDIFMPNCNGLSLLSQIKKEYPDQKIIIISGFGNIPIAIEAVQKGAINFIEKPLNLDEILNKISFLKDKKSYQLKNHITDKNLLKSCNIIGESHLFLELVQQAERLAPYPFPILIYGEHGTGKTSLARYIHEKKHEKSSDRVKFVTICCDTGLDMNIIETQKVCTLYLKHVDQLNKKQQETLLSTLETILDNKNIRIIVSSKNSLFGLMKENKFNETLFYHLNKAPIEIPPLRKRPYDIPLLINHYLGKSNNEQNKKVILNAQSIRLLRNREWPGNICELRQAIQKVTACSQDYEVVTVDSLTSILGEKTVQFIEEQSLHRFTSLDEATSEFKRIFLLYLLKKNHYNINQVSHRLNLSPVQLKNKLLELKINIQDQVL
jgi:DNA-binding NtrC family response regulator